MLLLALVQLRAVPLDYFHYNFIYNMSENSEKHAEL